MVKFYRKTLSLSALWVSKSDRLSDFSTSSWQPGDSALPLLVVRLLLAVFALTILSWSLVEGVGGYWMIYLTNWGVLLVVATTISGLTVSITSLCKKPHETTALPWYVSLYWVIFNVGVTVSVMITALYWILLYNPELQEELGVRALWLDITTHGLTSCIMVAELLISRTPVRLAHIYQPLSFGLWYAAFSGIYYAAGGTDANGNLYIYDVLDWQQPTRAAIVVVGSVVALIVLYLTLWSFAFFRDKLSATFVRTRSHDLPSTPPDRLNPRIV